jgi:hypothetical protein
MKKVLLATFVVIFSASCLAQTSSNEVAEMDQLQTMKQEELRVSNNLILPDYLPKSGALSKEVIKISNPKGIRVKYLAPRLISSSIYVQSLDEFSSKDKNITSQATYYAEANVIHLRKQGVQNTLFLQKSIASKFSATDVAYQRVIREDSNKVLHIYILSIDEKVIFIQSWSDYKKENEGNKKKFDTFVYHLILDLESQI